jgi:hypothetical protein
VPPLTTYSAYAALFRRANGNTLGFAWFAMARRELGYAPVISIEQGLAELAS